MSLWWFDSVYSHGHCILHVFMWIKGWLNLLNSCGGCAAVFISHEWDTWLSFTCGVEQMEVFTDLISPCPRCSVLPGRSWSKASHSRLFRAWWNPIAMAFNQKYGESLFCCYVTLADGTFIFIAIVGLFNGGHISCYWSKLLYQLFSSRAVQHWALKAWMI